MQHANAALMRKVDEALLAGDFAGFLALHTDDAVMHVPGHSPVSGDHYGRDGIAAVFQRELSMLDASAMGNWPKCGFDRRIRTPSTDSSVSDTALRRS